MQSLVRDTVTPVGAPIGSQRGAPAHRLVLLLAAVIWLWPVPALAKISLVFGMFAPDKPAALAAQLRPSLDWIAAAMTERLGEPVEIRIGVVRSYDESIHAIAAGRVDFMRLGPIVYVMAKALNADISILAMEKKDGKKAFTGVICVRADSDIADVGQLRGRSLAFGPASSTLGRYIAQYFLLNDGIRARDLARYEYFPRNDRIGRAIGAGAFDAGALEEATFTELVRSGIPLRAIATFESVTRPWVARAGMDQHVESALRAALLGFADQSALADLRFEGFLAGDDSEYAETRAAVRDNHRFFE